MFADIPPELLRLVVEPLPFRDRCNAARACKSLHDAVRSSKWTSMGNGVLILTQPGAEEGRTEPSCLHVSFGGVVNRMFTFEEGQMPVFARMHQLFEKLHLKEIKLNYVHLDLNLLRPFNEFIDNRVTFDRLTVCWDINDSFTERDRELMQRAKKEVVIEAPLSVLTLEFILSVGVPVKFNVVGARRNHIMLIDEDVFMALLRKGHSLIKLTVKLRSMKLLKKVIETITSSTSPRRLDVCILGLPAMVERELRIVGTEITPREPYCNWFINGSQYPDMDVMCFAYLGATIHLGAVRGRIKEARLVAQSGSYEDSAEERLEKLANRPKKVTRRLSK